MRALTTQESPDFSHGECQLDFLIDLDTLNFNDKKDMQYFDKKYIMTDEEFNKNQRYRKLKKQIKQNQNIEQDQLLFNFLLARILPSSISGK
jgi:hypothetical protein